MNELNNIIVTNVIEVFTVYSPRKRFEIMHNRKSYGLSFCMNGKIIYTQNGKSFVSDSNHAVILPKGQDYFIYGKESGYFPVINFECLQPLSDEIVTIPIENPSTYINYFKRLESLFLFNNNRAEIMSIFYEIIHNLSSENKTGSILLPAIKYIENNYQNPKVNNFELAAKCNISEVYLRKLFLKQFNTTPKQFIIDIRIQKAKQLLSEGTITVEKIAEKCGFSTPYHFCRLFKKRTGFTPSEYSKRNRLSKI